MSRPAGAETPEEIAERVFRSVPGGRFYERRLEEAFAAALRAEGERRAAEMRERATDYLISLATSMCDSSELAEFVRALPLSPPAQDGGSDTQP